ncbi:MAG: tyrosine-type recombinase/integrase [Candidatus Delongbacteria bacterium]
MLRIRFTKAALEALQGDGAKRTWVFDDQVPALACMVTPAGGKSFYVVKHRKGRTHQVRLGSVQELAVDRARRMAIDMVMEILAGRGPAPARQVVEDVPAELTLMEAFEEYMAHAATRRRDVTLAEYRRAWDMHLSTLQGRPVRELRRKDVEALHQRIGKDNGRIAANRLVATLKAVLHRAIAVHELGIPNPAARIEFFEEQERTRRLEAHELPAFLKAIDEDPSRDLRDFILLLLFTGVRKTNLLAMRWEHVSREKALWTIPGGESKTHRELHVVLSSHAMAILEQRAAGHAGPFVFPGRQKGHMASPQNGWDRICVRAGLTDLHMHDLRRSLASFQIDTGTPLEVIQKTLGHESKVTTEIYARLALDPVRASVERATEEMLRAKKD